MAAVPAAAQTDFMPVFRGTAQSGNSTNFNYDLVFTPISAGDTLQAGDYVTFYDVNDFFFPFIFRSDFTTSTQNSGITPANTSPTDNSNLTNVTFTYTGGTLSTATTFTGFLIDSNSNTVGLEQFAGQYHNSNNATGGLGMVLGPSLNVAATPEPSQFASFGLGALCLGGLVLRARRRKAIAA